MKVALVWNGDKNSVLMYDRVKERFEVSFFLTFLQEEPSHSNYLSIIKRQSRRFGVPFFWARVDPPCLQEYKETIIELKKDYGIEGVVTDSAHKSWIEDACIATEMELVTP